MRKHMVRTVAALAAIGILGGCSTTGDVYRSDVYDASSVNQAQEVQTVQIIAVFPARVAVSNASGREQAQVVGAILGALAGVALGNQTSHHTSSSRVWGGIAGGLAGSAIGGAASEGSTLVDGVQISFRYRDKLFNSVQVGQLCEYKPGTAIMVSPSPNVTRIQPNNPGGCVQPKE